jgi:hypothetical protein
METMEKTKSIMGISMETIKKNIYFWPPQFMETSIGGIWDTGWEKCQFFGTPGAKFINLTTLETIAYISSTRPGKHTKNYGKSPFLMGKFTIHGDVP